MSCRRLQFSLQAAEGSKNNKLHLQRKIHTHFFWIDFNCRKKCLIEKFMLGDFSSSVLHNMANKYANLLPITVMQIACTTRFKPVHTKRLP